MASNLVSGLVLIWLYLHAFVSGVQGREHEGLKKERKLSLHNDSTVTTMQKELASHAKGFVENAAQSNLLSKRGDSQLISYRATYQSKEGTYYGTIAIINTRSLPDIKSPDESSAEIWVANVGDGTPGNVNRIQVGWHVHPLLYNDNDTHFFTYWTADRYQKTGCYNLRCQGFVLTNHSRLVPGIKLKPTSSYDKRHYYMKLKIYKDPQTGDWLLFEGVGLVKNFVGYWPKSLFTSLAKSASHISWGGHVTFSKSHKSPPMGSGHFPRNNKGEAAEFTAIKYIGDQGESYYPGIHDQFYIIDKEACYNVSSFIDAYTNRHPWSGRKFYFGGPGGCNS